MKKMNNKGFTLIELLAVLVILVVIMSIAIPSITSSVERSKRLNKEMRLLILLKHKLNYMLISIKILLVMVILLMFVNFFVMGI